VRSRPLPRLDLCVLTTSIAAILALTAHAELGVWASPPTSGSWSDPTKWQGGIAPFAGGSAEYALGFYNGTTAYTATNNLPGVFRFNNIVFAPPVSGFGTSTITIAGAPLQPSASGNNPLIRSYIAQLVTLSTPLQLDADFTAILDNGPVTLSGAISGGFNLIRDGVGSGALTLSGTNTFTGNITMRGGTLTLGTGSSNASLGANGNTIFLQPHRITNAPGLANNGGAVVLEHLISVDSTLNSVATFGGTQAMSFSSSGTRGLTGGDVSTLLVLNGTNQLTLTNAGIADVRGTWRIDNGTLAVSGANESAFGDAENDFFLNGGSIANSSNSAELNFGAQRVITLMRPGFGNKGDGGTLTTGGASGGIMIDQANQITGPGGFKKSGAGTLTIAQPQNFGGFQTVTVTSGVLNVNSDAALGSTTNRVALTASGSTFQLASGLGSLTIARQFSLSNAGAVIDTNSNTLSITEKFDTGTTGFTKAGGGVLGLSQLTGSGGTITVAGGMLRLDGPVSNSRAFALSGGHLDLNGFSARASNLSGPGSVLLGGTGATSFEVGGSGFFGGTISGSGTLTITGSGGVMQGASPFTGAVRVEGGTLSLGGLNGSLSSASSYVVRGGGRLIAGDELDFNNNQGPRLNPAAFVTLGGTTGGGTLEVKGSNFNFDERIRGINLQPGASSIVVGGGFVELVVTGNSSESVTRTVGSTVTVGSGVELFIGMVSNLPVFVNSTYVGWTIGSYDFVSLFMDAAPVTQQPDPNQWTSPTINYDTGTTNPTASLTSSRTINGLRIGGGIDPTLTLDAGTTLSINNGMIIGAAAGASIVGGTLTSNNLNDLIVVGNGDTRIGSTIANRGPTFPIGFTKAGPGTVTLGNGASDTTSNTFTGPTTLNEGTLVLDKATGQNAVSGNVLVLGGTLRFARAGQIPTSANVTLSKGTINFTNNANPAFRTLTFNGGTISNLGTMTLNGDGVVLTLGSNTTMPGGIALTNAASATVRYNGTTLGSVLNGAVNLGAAARIFDVDDGDAAMDLRVVGLMSGASAGGSFTKTGPGRLELGNSSNSFTGNITVDAGSISISTNGQLGAANNGVILNGGSLASGSTFTLGSGRTLTIGALGGTIEQSANTLSLGAPGQLSGSGTLTKTGAGALALLAANPTFTGNTVLAEGTVAANSVDALGPAGSTSQTLTFAGGDLSTTVALSLARNVKLSDNATISGMGSFATSGALTFEKGATLNLTTEGAGAFTGTIDGPGTIAFEPVPSVTPLPMTISATAGPTFDVKFNLATKNSGDATLAFTRDLPGASIVVGSLSQTSARPARVGLVGSSGFTLTAPVTFLHDPASGSANGFLVERNGPGLNDNGQVFTVAGEVTGNGSVTIGGIGLNGVGELAFAGALTHTGSAAGNMGPGNARFATGPGGLFTEIGAFVRFTDPSKLPSGGARGQTSYLGAFALFGSDFGQGYVLQGSTTPYSFANTPSANSPAYKFVFGADALTAPAGVLGATDGLVTLRADVLIHGGAGSTENVRLGLLARGNSLFTLGDASQPVRFQPSEGRDVVTKLNTNASATTVENNSGTRTLIKLGSGTVALGNVEYTDVAGTALPTPDGQFSWQIGRGTTGNSGANSYFDGALRETGNTIATSLNNGSTSWTVYLRGGVLESNNARANYASTNGRFERSLGTGRVDVNWGPGGGGFAAADGPFNIRIGGTTSPLEWQAPNFVGNGEPLIFGSRTANAAVTFENPVALANANDQVVTREFRVIDNPGSTGDRTVLAGEIRDRGNGAPGGSGTRAFLKSGDGILELAGALNNYEGPTTVMEGTLLVSGELTTSAEIVSIQAGGTLGGSGQIARPVSVLGSLSPGDGIGVLELESSLLLGGGSILNLEIGGTSPGDGPGFHDQLRLTSATQGVSIESTATLSLTLANNYAPADGSAFYLVTRSDSATYGNAFAGLPEGATVNLGGLYSGQITYQANWNGTPESSAITGGNDLAIINVVPEPGSAALVLTGMVALIGRRRGAQPVTEKNAKGIKRSLVD
jgi:fibronectin-binding autotransporter adhesin